MSDNGLNKEGISQLADAGLDGLGEVQLSNLPLRGGVCLKPQHYQDILGSLPDVGWFEIHAENYLGAGGAPLHNLEKICQHYPLSIHGVGTVSYTHLRAHETDSYLVCRLLLEKKK